MYKKLITTISMVSALAVAAVASRASAAGAGPRQSGGGCHMAFSPSSTGLANMMVGSAHGEGAANMADTLSRFSPLPFCGA